jgi:hypothetical protein
MGQAKARGSFEKRKAKAMIKNAAAEKAAAKLRLEDKERRKAEREIESQLSFNYRKQSRRPRHAAMNTLLLGAAMAGYIK